MKVAHDAHPPAPETAPDSELVITKCTVHGKPFLPEGKGLWEVYHLGCDYPAGSCDCWCGTYCRLRSETPRKEEA